MSENAKQHVPAIVQPRAPGRVGTVVPIERKAATTSAVTGTVSEVMAGLQTAIEGMNPDDIDVTITASTEGDKSSAHFRLRAYRSRRNDQT